MREKHSLISNLSMSPAPFHLLTLKAAAHVHSKLRMPEQLVIVVYFSADTTFDF